MAVRAGTGALQTALPDRMRLCPIAQPWLQIAAPARQGKGQERGAASPHCQQHAGTQTVAPSLSLKRHETGASALISARKYPAKSVCTRGWVQSIVQSPFQGVIARVRIVQRAREAKNSQARGPFEPVTVLNCALAMPLHPCRAANVVSRRGGGMLRQADTPTRMVMGCKGPWPLPAGGT